MRHFIHDERGLESVEAGIVAGMIVASLVAIIVAIGMFVARTLKASLPHEGP